jgi:hypothetical protein
MTLAQAVSQLPMWLQIWLNWLVFATLAFPLVLLIWKQSRLAAIVTVASTALNGVAVTWLYNQLGYVKLLGLPHIFLWGPAAYYLYKQVKRPDMPTWPKRIMLIILTSILISLAFDVVDVARYALGERTPLFPK